MCGGAFFLDTYIPPNNANVNLPNPTLSLIPLAPVPYKCHAGKRCEHASLFTDRPGLPPPSHFFTTSSPRRGPPPLSTTHPQGVPPSRRFGPTKTHTKTP